MIFIKTRLLIAFCVCTALIMSGPCNAYPDSLRKLGYQGYLTDDAGSPLEGDLDMVFSIYENMTGGIPVWSEAVVVSVNNGVYDVVLGLDPANPLNIPFDVQYYIGIQVPPDQEMEPRGILTAVPYSIMSDEADTLDGMHASGLQRRISGECPEGSSIRAIKLDGSVACETDSTIEDAGLIYSSGAITIESEGSDIIITTGAGRITVSTSGEVVIEGGTGLKVRTDGDMQISAGGALALDGTVINLN